MMAYSEAEYRAALGDAIDTLTWSLSGELDEDDESVAEARHTLEVLSHLLLWHGGEA
jgi:phage tail protein X